MINLARQAFGNQFQPTVGSSFQPGSVGSPGRCPFCGNAVALGIGGQSHIGFNPGLGATLGQQTGGNVQYGLPQGTGFGQTNPLAQFGAGVTPGINQMNAPVGAGWQNVGNPGQLGTGGRGNFGIDTRYGVPSQFGYGDPNIAGGLSPIANDPISALLTQQLNPWTQQQQLPIRPLIGPQQGFQQPLTPLAPGIQWADQYRTFIEAQLLSQLVNNPLYQLQRAYGGVPEFNAPGMPFGGQQFNPLVPNSPGMLFGGQQFNPLVANSPFFG